jgi:hypothetical protein
LNHNELAKGISIDSERVESALVLQFAIRLTQNRRSATHSSGSAGMLPNVAFDRGRLNEMTIRALFSPYAIGGKCIARLNAVRGYADTSI